MKIKSTFVYLPAMAVLFLVACGGKSGGDKESKEPTEGVAKPAKEVKLVCRNSTTDSVSGNTSADIYISIDGNETILKSGDGLCMEITKGEFEASSIPADATMALGLSRAGGGDFFYLTSKDGKPVLFEGTQMITQQGVTYTWKQMEMTFPD